MAGYYPDISRFGGYDANLYGPAGTAATPFMMGAADPSASGGGAGASVPTGAWFQKGASSPAANDFNFGLPGGGAFPAAPGGGGFTPPGSGGGGGSGLGFNMDTGRLVLGGLQTIGNLWGAWQANKLAKEQFAFQKDFANTNLANQIKSYNTTLEDRGRSRAFTESQTPGQAAAYIANNRLPDRQV